MKAGSLSIKKEFIAFERTLPTGASEVAVCFQIFNCTGQGISQREVGLEGLFYRQLLRVKRVSFVGIDFTGRSENTFALADISLTSHIFF